jgi:hypothetical protein
MRYASLALIACSLAVPVVLVLDNADLPTFTPAVDPNQPPRPAPDPNAVKEFEELKVECEEVLTRFVNPEDVDPAAEVCLESTDDPRVEYFHRFLVLARLHVEDPVCPLILDYAVCRCGGPHVTPADWDCMRRLRMANGRHPPNQ